MIIETLIKYGVWALESGIQKGWLTVGNIKSQKLNGLLVFSRSSLDQVWVAQMSTDNVKITPSCAIKHNTGDTACNPDHSSKRFTMSINDLI